MGFVRNNTQLMLTWKVKARTAGGKLLGMAKRFYLLRETASHACFNLHRQEVS